MKKLFLGLAISLAFATQAQTIVQDSLLGGWSLRKISLMGNMADLQTGEIQVSDAFAAEKGQTKEALAEQFKKRLPGMHGSLWFYTGSRMEYQIADKKAAMGSYVLTQENNKQYLADEYSGSKIEVYFKEGLLYWEVLTNDGMVIMAWQKDAP